MWGLTISLGTDTIASSEGWIRARGRKMRTAGLLCFLLGAIGILVSIGNVSPGTVYAANCVTPREFRIGGGAWTAVDNVKRAVAIGTTVEFRCGPGSIICAGNVGDRVKLFGKNFIDEQYDTGKVIVTAPGCGTDMLQATCTNIPHKTWAGPKNANNGFLEADKTERFYFRFNANDPPLPTPTPEEKPNQTKDIFMGSFNCGTNLSVGGIAELPDVDATPLEASGSSGMKAETYAVILIAILVAAILGGAAWYARRRVMS